MMKQWLSFRALAVVALTAGLVAVLAVSAQAPTPRPAGPGAPGAHGDMAPRAIGPLNQAYDMIAAVTVWLSSEHGKLSREHAALFEQAKDFYKHGHRAFQEGHDRSAMESALASSDAARGLLLVLSATGPKVEGLPPPPTGMSERRPSPSGRDGAPGLREPDRPRPPTPAGTAPRPPDRTAVAPPPGARDRGGPDTPPRPPDRGAPAAPGGGGVGIGRAASMGIGEFIREVRDEIEDADASKGPGQQFTKAAREALDEAQRFSEEGHYRRAFHFALAAESWAHVGDHLRRAESRGPDRPRTDTDHRDGGTRPPRPPR